MPIKYIVGDATEPIVNDGLRVITHVCNDVGKWGAGFSKALSSKYKEPEEFFRRQYKYTNPKPKLGDIQWQFPEMRLAVVNMIAMRGVNSFGRIDAPIRYDALELCLERLREGALAVVRTESGDDELELTFHAPRIGAGLARGDWGRIEGLINEVFWDLEFFVYDLE